MTLIQFVDCDTELLNRLHVNQILSACLLQHVLTISAKLQLVNKIHKSK